MKTTAVVLMNLGGPNGPDEIRPFLYSLFSDPAIIGLPQPLRWLVARLISSRRTREATKIYSYLGGQSPLLKNTEAQREALQDKLGDECKVFIAMRHAFPKTEDAVREVEAYGPDEIVLLPLYPQLSTTTTSSSFKEWYRCYGRETPTREVCCYPKAPAFVGGYVELIRESYDRANIITKPRLLLTAHGLPEKTIARGDPYQYQVEQTAQAIIKELNIDNLDAVVCYQSRVGPMKWIEPSTEQEIIKASKEGKPLVVAPISFVSEHSETLVELDIEYKELALQNGCPTYERVPAVGTHPSYIEALAELVKEGRPQNRICPETFGGCPCKAYAKEERKVA